MARAGPEKAVRPCWDRVRPSYGDLINSAREVRTKTVTLLLYKYTSLKIKCCARSVRHELGPNIFPSGPPTQSLSTYFSLVHNRNPIL